MANVSEQVGIRIKEYRQRVGFTQEELSYKANIHVSFLSEIERGLKKPSIESLEKLLSALNVSFLEFFDFEINVKALKDNPTLDKLVNDLQGRSEQEIELIYGITKQILSFEDKK